jgi:hypothetical protein
MTVTVTGTPTTTSLAITPASPTVYGQPLVLKAYVSSAFGPVPVGSVTFSVGPTPIGTVAVDDQGNAILPVATLPVGSNVITAVFGGALALAPSTSPVAIRTVTAAPSTVTVQSSTITATAGQPVSFPVTVASTPGTGTPTGSVTYLDGTTVLGTVPLDANGRATLTVASLSVGRHTITAAYSGDAGHAPATGAVAGLEIVADNSGQAVKGPTVLALKRYGYHDQPTYLVLSFSSPLNAASARSLANYTITEIVHGRGRHGHPIKVKVGSAIYDPSTNTVTLSTIRRLDVHKQYRLTVNGTTASGVRGASGSMLYAAGAGAPGSDYVATIDRKTLAGSATEVTSGSVKPAGQAHAAPASSQVAVDHLLAAGSLHARRRRRH